MAPAKELHHHECPATGCHKKFTCHEPGCARFYFKACPDHETAPDNRTLRQKSADDKSLTDIEDRNARRPKAKASNPEP